MPKKYADVRYYETKLKKVMERLGVEKYNYNWDRYGCWVEFNYKSQLYRFDHSVENAKNHGSKIAYGSDSFSQIVLALEDLARIIERGIYDLQKWVMGLKFLPMKTNIPEFFRTLGFQSIPSGRSEVETRYKNMCKTLHPDKGGSHDDFIKLNEDKELAVNYFEESE